MKPKLIINGITIPFKINVYLKGPNLLPSTGERAEPAAAPNCAIDKDIPIKEGDMLNRSLYIIFPKLTNNPAPKDIAAVLKR